MKATTSKMRITIMFLAALLMLSQLASTAAGVHGGYSLSQRPVSMISPFGRRRRYGRRRRRYNNYNRGPSHPTSVDVYDYSKHFLDDKNWMMDKKIRVWDPQYAIRRRPNQRTWSGRLFMANIVCYAIQTFNPKFTTWGMKLSERILAGKDLYRLITPVFLHGGLYHLMTNSYSLNNVGPMNEQAFGSGRFLASYLVAGASGNLLSAINSPNPALGASGAVFGVMASLLVFLGRNGWVMGEQGEYYQNAVTQTLLINLVMGAMNPMVDNWGHIGGAIGGAAMSWYFGPRLYIAEVPMSEGVGRIIVDKPIVRLPRSIESLPTNVSTATDRMMRRMKVWAHISDLPDKPWRKNRGKQIDYRRRKQNTPQRSIKPILPPDNE